MDSIESLFAQLGGPSEVGRIIGKSTEHAAAMKRRKSIPVRYWSRLMVAAQQNGVDLNADRLTKLHGPVPAADPAQPAPEPAREVA